MRAHPAADAVFVLCRPGMENDCAAELVERAAAIEVGGWCRTGEGWVTFHPTLDGDMGRLEARLAFAAFVFARQWLAVVDRARGLDPNDRAGAIAATVATHLDGYRELRVEHPDSDSGRPLARLAKALHRPIEAALADRGVHRDNGGAVLHVVLTAGDTAVVGLSSPHNSAPWPGGIPRLRVPKAAPSRSVAKLEEGLQLFLGRDEWASWLRPGRSAVDLGAAPGGWSWFLAERGIAVDAVDQAALAPAAAEHPRIRRQRADGFRYRPRRRVDWLVCDMVAQPHRIVGLVGQWLERGDCRHALCNLKLPMKQRWPTVRGHLASLAAALPPEGRWRAKQLYHDRDEITVFASRAPLD
jgi:23S rRNA (cytidine2498-2'-O)-methyltransferase